MSIKKKIKPNAFLQGCYAKLQVGNQISFKKEKKKSDSRVLL